ncbi:hypothetical protein Pmar_PMAR029511 [Perkinsus marinus ATCC 50983]|uniref:FAD-binding PCMH-type domain-containing protein n=1 Tax=Perkinsus marinus (strain ATCC 50983 / TXsc) TaxID=423536 RepID=C5LD03_PERM5|nr:hypothetical protein Pmar_PMAR029511 [Perkinsus marinus ATCC 50983]EER05347.1 hypothetical protein Pmar_PMAR029511 [Perkinsus marinus ATCC 50983]|eukprot:XP_002773531.1 hypothetical protein Pmar_PMAR029511 [Perkinsus marinus ATCC 50983]
MVHPILQRLGLSLAVLTVVSGELSQTSDPVKDAINELKEKLPPNATITDHIPDPFFSLFGASHGITPAAMVSPDNSDQVATALTICHKYKVPAALRSGEGHSYIGQSNVNKGIILSLQRFKDLNVQAVDGDYIVQMGGGLDLIEAYTKMALHQPPLGFAGGFSPSTGIGGYFSGGGHGLLGPKYGIGADRLVAADIVIYDKTANAFQLVKATLTNEHADLLFAIRGGMGGNYGVVVNFYYKAFITGSVLYSSGATNIFEVENYVGHMKSYMDFIQASTTPKEFNAALILGYSAFQALSYYFSICQCDSRNCSSCLDVTNVFRNYTGITNSSGILPDQKEMTFVEAMWTSMNCFSVFPTKGIPGASMPEIEEAMTKCRAIEKKVVLQWIQIQYYYPSILTHDNLEAMVSHVLGKTCASKGCYQYVLPYTHQMLEEPTDCLDSSGGKCTSFDHRQKGFSIEHGMFLLPGEDPSKVVEPWMANMSDTVRPFSTDTKYQNYIESTMTRDEWIPRYFPHNGTYERLQAVKCKYNGIDMFDFRRITNFTIDLNDCEDGTSSHCPAR